MIFTKIDEQDDFSGGSWNNYCNNWYDIGSKPVSARRTNTEGVWICGI
jgi:hypothetical protein